MLIQPIFQLTETAEGFERFGTTMIQDGICVITDIPDGYVQDELVKKVGLYAVATHYGWVIILPECRVPYRYGNNSIYSSFNF